MIETAHGQNKSDLELFREYCRATELMGELLEALTVDAPSRKGVAFYDLHEKARIEMTVIRENLSRLCDEAAKLKKIDE